MASSHRSHSISARLVSIGLAACVSLGACAGLRPGSADDQSMTAMATALADTSASRRVYLPDEVERPATVIEEGDKRAVALRTIAEPSEVRAGIRGVIDARGVVERGTLLALPGSDGREAALLFDEATRTRWRPALLADGRAVRQLFEWRVCRSGGSSCAHYVAPPVTRALSRVDAP